MKGLKIVVVYFYYSMMNLMVSFYSLICMLTDSHIRYWGKEKTRLLFLKNHKADYMFNRLPIQYTYIIGTVHVVLKNV